MYRHIHRRLSPRKLQLLSCACCRLVWDELDDPRLRTAVEVAELYACGLAGEQEFAAARSDISAYADTDGREVPRAAAVLACVYQYPDWGLQRTMGWVQFDGDRATACGVAAPGAHKILFRISDLIREVVGNPFRPWKVVPDFLGGGLVQPDGRTVPVTATARQLAAAIHAERAFDRLPVLADAAEEGGITDRALLDHLRHGTGHVRGCWALDLLLGKG